ncbi:hypothetical protein PGTUg99_002693 [Puccinia graminis f. sp. tritici]|uniref:Erythromycin biosynthesis protein CIII-like C-terminal domain-containing protein n=1 Tax=Puccinia graminis f. sp. tritici TaxID=56615 RepID=A0A5B0NQH7_PUCGR|nr:hypothetical protein PGTUg99_002693 [Puccinia graminis f. sp. tritici]
MTDAIVGAVEESNVFAIISGGWTAGAAEGATKGAAEGATKGSTETATKGATETATEEKTEAEKEAEIATAYMKEKIGERPNSMHYVDSVPHEWLFPQISAALHHGGAGTTAASIRAGIPTLIKPFFGDQTFWAQRVEKLGVGTHVASLDKKDIAAALFKATTNEKQIAAAKALGKQVDSEDGVKIAIDSIFNTRAINLKKKPRPSSTKLGEIKAQLSSILEELPFGGIWRTVRLKKQPPESQSSSKTSSEVGHIALMEKKPSEKIPLLSTP